MTPSKDDLAKRKKKLDGFRSKLNPDGSPKEKPVLSVVRGAIRKAWMKSDTKLAYLYERTVPDMDDETRTKWLIKCEMCGLMFKLADVEVDHIHGNHTFTKIEDFESYFNNILMVGFDGLQILCKDDHATKTYADKMGVTLEQAVIERQVIEVCKGSTAAVSEFLTMRGIAPASNAKKRREQVLRVLQPLQNP
jgi:hypothetical protein